MVGDQKIIIKEVLAIVKYYLRGEVFSWKWEVNPFCGVGGQKIITASGNIDSISDNVHGVET